MDLRPLGVTRLEGEEERRREGERRRRGGEVGWRTWGIRRRGTGEKCMYNDNDKVLQFVLWQNVMVM